MTPEQLKREIKRCGYTQTWVAQQLGMIPTTLYRKLDGTRTLTFEEGIEICRIIGLVLRRKE